MRMRMRKCVCVRARARVRACACIRSNTLGARENECTRTHTHIPDDDAEEVLSPTIKGNRIAMVYSSAFLLQMHARECCSAWVTERNRFDQNLAPLLVHDIFHIWELEPPWRDLVEVGQSRFNVYIQADPP